MSERFRNQFGQGPRPTPGDRIFGGPPPRSAADEDYVDDVPARDVDADVVQGQVARPATPRGLAARGQGQAFGPHDKRSALAQFGMTRTGLIIPDELPLEEWERARDELIHWDEAVQWWIGDMLAFGKRQYKKGYRVVAALTGKEVKTLRNYVYVATRIEMSRRRDKLTFGHHDVVASMDAESQDAWLAYAVQEEWSVTELREAIRAKKKAPRPVSVMTSDVKTYLHYLSQLNGVPQDDETRAGVRECIDKTRDWLDSLERELKL